MAKKTSKKTPASDNENSMKSKVEIKQPMSHNQEKVSRLVGSIFIGLGVLLVAFGIFSYIKYREDPILDPELESPTLEEVTTITNGEKVNVRGEAQGYDSVFIYVDNEKVGEAKVDDESKFEYEYIVDAEGEYFISIAGVRGFPNRYISPISASKSSIVDRTGPDQSIVTLKYGEETNKATFILIGTTEANASVEVKRGTVSVETVADSDGNFRIDDIPLDEGKNVFSVYLTDVAGNTVILDEKVRVSYSITGTVNGDAVIDENIPQAAGTFDELIGNQLMMLLGLIALGMFILSSGVVYLKQRR